MTRRLREYPDKASRAQARLRLGPLRFQRVAPKTRDRYRRAAQLFQQFQIHQGWPLAAGADEMDQQICSWIEHLWVDGEGRNLAGDTLSGIQFLLGRRRLFPMAWELFGTWGRVEMPLRAPPMTVLMLCGVAQYLWAAGLKDAAILTLAAFHCLLRTGEMFSLRAEFVAINAANTGMVALPWTKSGARRGAQEMVTVDDPVVGRALAHLRQLRGGGGPLLAMKPAQYRAVFEKACAEVGLSGLGH